MRLVTFDDGLVGELRDDRVVELDVPSMREYFERGEAPRATGASVALEDVRLRAPIVPKKFFHTAGNFREHEEESKNVAWSHEIAPWIVFFQNVDAIIGPDDPVVYPEHLTEELDYELELAVVIRKAGKWFSAGGGGRLHRRLRDLQRHHRARHPAAGDALRRLLVLQGDRHLLPARAVDRDAGRDPRPARPGDGAARERRAAAGLALEQHVRDDPGDPQPLLGARLLGGRRRSRPGTVSGVAGFSDDPASLYLKPGDVMEAEIERIGVLRNPVVSWQEAHGEPAPPARPLVTSARARHSVPPPSGGAFDYPPPSTVDGTRETRTCLRLGGAPIA